MRYTVPWLPAGREPRDTDELSGTAIMLACLVGELVARRGAPVDRDVLAAALLALFESTNDPAWTDDDLINLISTSILLARALGLIEPTEDEGGWRSTTPARRRRPGCHCPNDLLARGVHALGCSTTTVGDRVTWKGPPP